MGKRIQDLDLKIGQEYKCVHAVGKDFIKDKTYPVSMSIYGKLGLGSEELLTVRLGSSSLFELVEEGFLLGHLDVNKGDKVKCVSSKGPWFIEGKIYPVGDNGVIHQEDGMYVNVTSTTRFIKVEEETKEGTKPLDSEVVALLNNVLYKVFPEMDGSIENRNVYIEGGKLVKWVDNPWPEMPVKVTLRTCTDGEVQVWEGYKKILEGLSK